MKYFIVLICLLIAISCDKSSEIPASIIGKWRLIETLVDPGDGSGTWSKTNYDAYIIFKNDSSFENHNGNIDNIGIQGGKYSLVNDSAITFFDSSGRNVWPYYHYKINIDTLTIMGGCYEACGSKYIKNSIN